MIDGYYRKGKVGWSEFNGQWRKEETKAFLAVVVEICIVSNTTETWLKEVTSLLQLSGMNVGKERRKLQRLKVREGVSNLVFFFIFK